MSHRTAELERQLWGPNLTNFLLVAERPDSAQAAAGEVIHRPGEFSTRFARHGAPRTQHERQWWPGCLITAGRLPHWLQCWPPRRLVRDGVRLAPGRITDQNTARQSSSSSSPFSHCRRKRTFATASKFSAALSAWPSPVFARDQRRSSNSNSSSRPTRAVRPVVCRASKRLPTELARSAAQARAGPAMPLRSLVPRSLSSKRLPSSRRVPSAMTTLRGSA
jgi:hypothetical protein